MTQTIDRETKLAAQAIRASSGACHQAERQIGCRYCWSQKHRGCVFLAEAVIDALFPSPGANGGGTGGGIAAAVAA